MAYIDDINSVACLDLPWEELSGKNILVTGATGLICSTLVEILMSRKTIDYHVYASGRSETRVMSLFSRFTDNPYFHFIKYDVREQLQSDISFHIIIAGAGVASPQLYASDPVSVMKSNFDGVDHLFTYGINHGLKSFLYISSGEVYGEGDGRPFTEDYSGYVNCATLRACYPSAKRATESLCIAYGHQYNIDVRIARPCHIYGPNFSDSDKRAYAAFIRNAVNGSNIVMKSDGTQLRSWCFSVDCASALLYVLLLGYNRNAYNIANSESIYSIKELARTIASICNTSVIIDNADDLEKKGYSTVKKTVLPTEKIESLGWRAMSTFYDGLNSTINYIKNGHK